VSAAQVASLRAEVDRQRMIQVSPKWMYFKAVLFLVIGGLCFALIVLQSPSLTTVVCSGLMIWAFCRAYYFAFYVITHYIDGEYRFAGLLSFAKYEINSRRARGVSRKDPMP